MTSYDEIIDQIRSTPHSAGHGVSIKDMEDGMEMIREAAIKDRMFSLATHAADMAYSGLTRPEIEAWLRKAIG